MAYTHNLGFVAPVMAKRESTIGSDSTPTGGTDDVLTYSSPNPFSMGLEKVVLDPHRSSLTSGSQDIPTQRVWNIGFQFALQGSASAGSSAVNGYAGIAALLTSCGLKETTVASTSLTYAPATLTQLQTPSGTSPKCGSATVWGEYHGKLHKATSVWGNIVFSGGPRGLINCAYRGMGKYSDPTHASISGFTGGTNRAQAAVGTTMTLTRSGGSAYTPRLVSFSMDIGNRYIVAEDMNSPTGLHSIVPVRRFPTFTCRIGLNGDDGSNLDYEQIYADCTTPTDHAISLIHGSGTGRVWTFTAATAQPLSITPVGDDLRMIDITYKLYSTTAEGEYSWVVA